MTFQDVTEPASEGRFASIVVLQQAHLEHLQRWSKTRKSKEPNGDTSRDIPAIHAFMARVQQTGAVLDRGADRSAAQAVLDYWTTELALVGDEGGADQGARTLVPFDPTQFPTLEGKPSPFKGLAAFAAKDAALFFGRENTSIDLARMVETRPIVVVSGPSGSGKSSLIQAGLVPQLLQSIAGPEGPYELLDSAIPGSRPLAALLKVVVPADAGAAELASLRTKLAEAPESLAEIVARYHGKPVILIIDQFEEIFTLQQADGKNEPVAFARALAALSTSHHIVISIRDDYIGQLQTLEPLTGWVTNSENHYSPPQLEPREIKKAIERPAEAVGLRFEDGLVDELVKDVAGEPAALPLLQFTLTQLWDRKQRNRVTRETYLEVGRPREALKRAADKVLEDLILPQNVEVARRIFLKLVTPATESEFLRNPRTREYLWSGENDPPAVDRVLERFLDAGLLRKQVASDDEKDDRFDVAHEALIRNWPWLTDLLKNEWRDHEKFWRLKSTAELWKSSGRPSGYLLSGSALDDARAFLRRSASLDELIKASEQEEQGRQAEDRRRELADVKRKWVARTIAVVILLIFVGAASAIYLQSKLVAEKNQHLDEKEDLINQLSSLGSVNKSLETRAENAERLLGQSNAEKVRISTTLSKLDLQALREFLSSIGVPAPTVDRLMLGQPPADTSVNDALILRDEQRDRSSETVVTNSAVHATALQSGGPTCSGSLWIGRPESKVIDNFPKNPNDLNGRTFKVLEDIRLRKTAPNEAYVMSEQVGVVPSGTEVVAKSEPVAYPRPSGRQYWVDVSAPAEVCTNIFIQYFGVAAKAEKLTDVLEKLGYQVPPVQQIASAKGKAEVRFFDQGDEAIARKVAGQLSSQFGGNAVKPVSLVNWPYTKPAKGTLELWVDLSGP